MTYRDKNKNIMESNSAYNTIHSAVEELEMKTKLFQPLIQNPGIPELAGGITSAVDTMTQNLNHITAMENIVAQTSKIAEITRPLTEISALRNNNIVDLISRISTIFADLQPVSPAIQGLADALTDTHFYQIRNGIETIVSTINNINYPKMFDKISSVNETFETIAQNMVKGIDWVDQINFDHIANSLVQPEILEKTILEYKQATGVESTASDEEITELSNDIQDIAVDNRNWQQKLAEKAVKWKEKNPVICFFIVYILLALSISIAASFIYGIVTAPKAAIKEEPSATGDVIYNISINQKVTIVDDIRYYYKIEYYDKETDETVTGWISKRSIEINSDNSFNE